MSLVADLRLCRAPVLPFMVMGLGWGTFAAYVPEMKAALGVGDGALGLLLLCSSVGLVTAMWIAPRLDDRLNALALPVVAAALAMAFALPGLVTQPVVFAGVMVLLGASSGMTDVIMNARVSELEMRHRRALMNLNHAMFSFAYAGAAILCSFARAGGLPAIAVFAGVTAVGFGLAPLMRGKIPVDATDPAQVPFPGGIVLFGGLVVLLAFLVENAMEGWSALHIERSLGGAPHQGALGPAVLGITMGVGRLTGHFLSARLEPRSVIVGAALLSAVGLGVAGMAAGPAAAYAGFAIAGLGVSVIAPLALALVGQAVSARARTDAIARASVIGFLGFFLGPSLMGGLSEIFGLAWAFVAVAGLVLIVPFCVARMNVTVQSN